MQHLGWMLLRSGVGPGQIRESAGPCFGDRGIVYGSIYHLSSAHFLDKTISSFMSCRAPTGLSLHDFHSEVYRVCDFFCLEGVPKSVQVLSHGTEAVMVLTSIIPK